MKKRFKLSLIILIIVMLAIFIGGCSKKEVFEVVFVVGDYKTDTPLSLTVNKGQKIAAPSLDCIPQDGFEFVWYTDAERRNVFENTGINSNITLYLGERGRVYQLSYANIEEAWFDIQSLPKEYTAGELTALPEPKENAPTKGYHPGNWYAGAREIGYEIDEEEFGDLTLTFVIETIEWEITYTNIDRIDLSEEEYTGYITNPNPKIYKVTDGIITLKNPELDASCPYPFREFSHWELVKNATDRFGQRIDSLEIDAFVNSFVILKAVWYSTD